MQMRVKILLPLLALTLAFFSCEKEELASDETLISEIILADNLQAVQTADLPQSGQKYIDDNYFDTYVEEAYVASNRGYKVTLGNGENLFFDLDGKVLDYDKDFVGNGPLGNVHPHGPCFRLRRWLRGHGGQHDCDGDGVPDGPFAFDPDELPETITDYVAENYPNGVIRRAAYRDDHYFVLLNGWRVLAFDADGNFLRQVNILEHCRRICNGLTADELPEGIVSYVQENFPDATFHRACSRGEATVVVLINDDQRVILGFDADGNLVFQRP